MAEPSEKQQDKTIDQPTESNKPSQSEALYKVVAALEGFKSTLERQELVQEEKSMVAEVTKAIGETAKRLAAARHPGTHHIEESRPCCECISSACCCFEIVLDSVRATQPQSILEPGDSGDIPGFANPLEVRFFAAIDGIGVLVPSLWGVMQLRVGGTLTGGKPGPWTDLHNIVIGKICLPKGESREIEVAFDAAEIDAGLERPIHLKDEFGTAAASLTLDCGCKKVYPAKPAVLRFIHGGAGGRLVC